MNKLYDLGNLYKGYPWGVEVEDQFGSTELHGPFASENQAWNYGMGLANESDGTTSFSLVKIETPRVRSIATAAEIRAHRAKDELVTKALGIGPGETKRIELNDGPQGLKDLLKLDQ